jgi:uncharacterized protein (TIGR03435 family)
LPTEFEVASVKPSDPAGRNGRFQIQPGGRLIAEGMPLRFLIGRAFNSNNRDDVVGLPAWVDSERFDITAKTPPSGASLTNADQEAFAPMIRALLVDRFKMIFHPEERSVSAYTLVAAKPKMKKADPASRTFCKSAQAPPGSPPGSRILNCQNATMAQFAEYLRGTSQELTLPVTDSTGLEGGWDFSLLYSLNFPVRRAASTGGADSAEAGAVVPAASEPTGGYTIFQAVEKELGLKFVAQKRPMTVTVIDHIEQKPTEN